MVALTVSLLAFIDFLREARGFLDGVVTGGSSKSVVSPSSLWPDSVATDRLVRLFR